MGLRYKKDILAELNRAGFSTYKLRRDKILSESTLQKLRTGTGVSWENVEALCRLLGCQPGDIIEYVEDDKTPEA